MQPDPRWSDLSQTRTYLFRFPGSVFTDGLPFPLGLSTTYREFLLLRPEPRTPGSAEHRCSLSQSSGPEAESSENKTPAPKRRRTSHSWHPRHASRPEVVEVTDEDDAPATADDPWNYDFAEADVQMSFPESTIAADARNYDPELEPAPPVVPPE
jgi:hypothetical protein